MAVIEFIASYGPWSWIVFGLILLALELVVPGGVLVWLGAAAIITGLNTLFIGIGWPLQWLSFGVLSIVLVVVWQAWVKRRYGSNLPSQSPLLNRRTARYLGREVTLFDPIVDGVGRVQIGDTFWRVTGPDLPKGAHVRITGTRASVLVVEPVGI